MPTPTYQTSAIEIARINAIPFDKTLQTAHSILGFVATPTAEELVKAYRALGLLIHPDKNENSAESTTAFKTLQTAYEFIKPIFRNSFQ